MISGRKRLHVVANGTMTGQRYIDEVLLPHVRLFRDSVDALGRQVAGRNYPPTNKNTLIRALTEEWDELPQQLLDNVVQSMLGRGNCERRVDVSVGLLKVLTSSLCESLESGESAQVLFSLDCGSKSRDLSTIALMLPGNDPMINHCAVKFINAINYILRKKNLEPNHSAGLQK
ncbi:hypothetical protein TNCV_4044411 [Trichonephila clavipes]|nr:hypothetical protein TNCV_4044411 [Trichonephila clavipes]